MKLGPTIGTLVLALYSDALAQSPAPAAVLNPASNIPAGLPNAGIAQGSIFVVYGKNLGPAAIVQPTALPLPTTAGLGGTSVQITSGGTTVTAPMIYSLASQIAGVLPSNTPTGNGTLTVTYNGASGSVPVQIVQSNFGASTVNQTGTGAAVVTFPNYNLITSSTSAKPGDVVVLWGTGLGPISGSDAVVPNAVDLGTPIKVYVGGVAANVTYRGRSAGAGLDQINFVVPPGVTGCYVSLVVQTQNVVSNTTTMAVAPGGGTCSDPNGIPVTGVGAPGQTTYSYGTIIVDQTSISIPIAGQTTTQNTISASAGFQKVVLAQASSTVPLPVGQSTIGSCTVFTFNGQPASPGKTGPVPQATGLDAGSVVSLQMPSGSSVNLTGVAGAGKGLYSAVLQSLPAGAYTFSNGTGGTDVGAFTARLNVSSPLVWTNQSGVVSNGIDRTQALQITWTGGDPASTVYVEGYSATTTANVTVGAVFLCTGSIAAGQFTVPPAVLLALPPSMATLGIPSGTLIVGASSNPQKFTAPGLDFGYLSASSGFGALINFK